MKASMNGVLNLSVLDGWWAEGYVPGGGWALKESKTYDNQQLQDELDVETLYNIIEDEIVPLYYKQSSNGYSCDWIQFIRKNFMQISPNFTTKRMLDEYYSKFYTRLQHRNSYLRENDFAAGRNLSSWKRKMLRNWNEIEVIDMKLHDSTARPLLLGEDFKASVELLIGELDPNDIRIDLLFGQKENDMVKEVQFKTEMKLKSSDSNAATYECVISNPQSGVFDYAIRMRPYNPDLPHYQDFNLVRWL
jgi:glucan phosphorylase